MRRYNVFHAFIMSFFSPGFYRDVGQKWKGIGFLYLLLLMTVAWIPTAFHGYYKASDFAKNDLPELIVQLPQIEIVDGELSIDQKSPYIIKDPDRPDVDLIIIDTSGKYKHIDDVQASMLILKKKAFIRDNKTGEVNEFVYMGQEETRNLQLTHDTIMKWLDRYTESVLFIFFICFYFLMLIISYIYRILQALLYAVCGYAFTSMVGDVKTDFNFLLRLSCIAITPAVIIATLIEFTSVHVPLLFYLVISLGYLFFAVYSNKGAAYDDFDDEDSV